MTTFSIAEFVIHWWNDAGENQSAGHLTQCLSVRYKPLSGLPLHSTRISAVRVR
jgi:hypothetical protein